MSSLPIQKTKHSATGVIRFLLGVAVALLCCFALQALVYYGLNGKTGKGESNYFSTLSRFQAAAHPAAEFAFAGSSITGRLPGREVGNQNIANLGSDGSPARDGVRMILGGHIAMPKWLIIETNTLFGGVGYPDTLLWRNRHSPWFVAGSRLPLLSASARPSAMLYSKLLSRERVLQAPAFSVSASRLDDMTATTLEPLEEERYQEYEKNIAKLQERGVRIVLAQWPAGKMTAKEAMLMKETVRRLQEKYQLSFVNLEQQIPREELQYTDSVHLGPESAAKILSTMMEFCQKMPTN